MQSSLTIFAYIRQKQSFLLFVDKKCENHDEILISIVTSSNFEKKKTFYKKDKKMQFKFKKSIKFNKNFNDFKKRILNWFENLFHDSEINSNHVIEFSITFWNQRKNNDEWFSFVHDYNCDFDQHRFQIMSSISIQNKLTYFSMLNWNEFSCISLIFFIFLCFATRYFF